MAATLSEAIDHLTSLKLTTWVKQDETRRRRKRVCKEPVPKAEDRGLGPAQWWPPGGGLAIPLLLPTVSKVVSRSSSHNNSICSSSNKSMYADIL